MSIRWPQLLYLAIVVYGLAESCIKHGEPKTGKFNAYAYVVAAFIVLSILSAGNFFAPCGGSQ